MENFSIDERSGVPIWVQLRNRLVYLIQTGRYQPGDQLPTVHEMAVNLNINYNTVNKVYRSMETSGLIMSKRGRGTFVAENPAFDDRGFPGVNHRCDDGRFHPPVRGAGHDARRDSGSPQDKISRMG